MTDETIKDCDGMTIGARFTALWTVKLGDWERGLIMAILGMPLGVLYDWATLPVFEFTWKALIKGGVAAGLAYIMKNLGTGKGGRILTNDPPKGG